uniref:Uncharacterized protein n=1 Tax=viral metagenome TaxID=1070528 RepID=A0A6H1ZWI2_9ZZZZ
MIEKPSLIICANVESADLTADGKLVIVLEKKPGTYPSISTLCKLVREFFQERDVYIYITILTRKEKL